MSHRMLAQQMAKDYGGTTHPWWCINEAQIPRGCTTWPIVEWQYHRAAYWSLGCFYSIFDKSHMVFVAPSLRIHCQMLVNSCDSSAHYTSMLLLGLGSSCVCPNVSEIILKKMGNIVGNGSGSGFVLNMLTHHYLDQRWPSTLPVHSLNLWNVHPTNSILIKFQIQWRRLIRLQLNFTHEKRTAV